jgi:deazaflavin-dependent oxidoreductase (nitroreductase family)
MSPSLRIFWRLHRALMRLSGGRFGKVGPLNALLLTTTGRKSGEPRDVALYYMRDGDAYVVVASYTGEDRDPAWWRNLKTNPDGEVRLAGARLRVRAREVEGAERERLWTSLVAADRAYAEYQERTKRRLPVVVLEPAG